MAEERSRLGRGLAALIGDVGAETPAHERGGERHRGQKRVPIEFVHANPRNPRRTFVEADLEELAASIRERGVIQPIVVRAARGKPGEKPGEAYEIIAGERRWRAAQRAGLHDLPVVIVEVSDAEALELAIVENVQRADLNPIEEAQGYLALMEEFKHSAEDVARIVGKSRPHIANTIRLARLPESVKALVRSGALSAGHARTLVGHADAETIAQDVVARGLSVRELEARMREPAAPAPGATAAKPAPVKDADTRALEKRLSDTLGLKIAIDHRGEGGSVTIRYSNLDQLDEVVRRLS